MKDPHAPTPGLVVGWRGPERGTKDYHALAILEQVLYQGTSSRLYQGLVKGKEIAVGIQGAMGFPLGDYGDYRAPGLLGIFIIYKPVTDAAGLVSLVQEEVDRIRTEGVGAEELARAKVQFRATAVRELTGTLERAVNLGIYANADGDARRLTADLPRFLEVTPEEIRQAVSRHLTVDNRVVIDIQPAAEAPPAPSAGGEED